jgi:hypothetical protein
MSRVLRIWWHASSIDKFKPVHTVYKTCCVVKAAEVVISCKDVIGKAFRKRQNPVTRNIAFWVGSNFTIFKPCIYNLHYNICHHTYCLKHWSFGRMWHCFNGWVVSTKLSQSRRWEYSATLLWEPQFWYCCLWFIHSRLNTTITALRDTEFGFVRDINGPLSTCKYYMNNSTVGLYGHYLKILFEQKRHVWLCIF